MTEFTQSEDQALDTVINNFGGNVRAGVVRVKELIEYDAKKNDTLINDFIKYNPQ